MVGIQYRLVWQRSLVCPFGVGMNLDIGNCKKAVSLEKGIVACALHYEIGLDGAVASRAALRNVSWGDFRRVPRVYYSHWVIWRRAWQWS